MVEYTIDHLSASQINLYIQCGLKYRFQYVDLIPRSFKSSGLVFGSLVHSTVEWFHKQRKMGKRPSLEMIYKILDADWFCQKLDNVEKGTLVQTQPHISADSCAGWQCLPCPPSPRRCGRS